VLVAADPGAWGAAQAASAVIIIADARILFIISFLSVVNFV
jgi:hypothetical protein